MKEIEQAYEKAKETIVKSSTLHGLYASGAQDGYNAVWSRDSMISMIGASLVDDKEFRETFKQSIITLAENQSANGQIPNCVDKWSERKPHVDFKSIDSNLWFIIGNFLYNERYQDSSLIKKYQENIEKAFCWLACQDSGEIGILTQLPTSDWQDAFPHRYGYTINTQALYYKALKLSGKDKAAEKLRKIVNDNIEDGLWQEDYYLSYRWKNHGKYKEVGNWFDSLGNLLAIIFDLADKKRAERILDYIKKNKINEPYPMKAIYPPITKNSEYWQDYYLDCGAGTPNKYLNGGIWPFIGGFYVLALIKTGRIKEAEKELGKLAESNLKGGFPEWINPVTKEANGLWQAWSAGCYILAYESLRKKRVLI